MVATLNHGDNDASTAAQQRERLLVIFGNYGKIRRNTCEGDISEELRRYLQGPENGAFGRKADDDAPAQSYAALIDGMRHVFGTKLPEAIDDRIRVDEGVLDNFTRRVLTEFRDNMREYNTALNHKADAENVAAIQEKAIRLYDKLLHSMIEKPSSLLPITVGQREMTVLNGREKTCAVLVAYQMAKDCMSDKLEAPIAQQNFIKNHIGAVSEMPVNILRKVGGAGPVLAAECDNAFAECVPLLEQAIVKGVTPLQMLALQGDEPFAMKAAAGARGLLTAAGQPLLPAALTSDQELSFVMRKLISAYSANEGKAAQAMYDGYRKATLDSFHPLPEVKRWNAQKPSPDSDYAALYALAETYLKQRSPSLPRTDRGPGGKGEVI